MSIEGAASNELPFPRDRDNKVKESAKRSGDPRAPIATRDNGPRIFHQRSRLFSPIGVSTRRDRQIQPGRSAMRRSGGEGRGGGGEPIGAADNSTQIIYSADVNFLHEPPCNPSCFAKLVQAPCTASVTYTPPLSVSAPLPPRRARARVSRFARSAKFAHDYSCRLHRFPIASQCRLLATGSR